ncbi:MAG: TatD family deoxyribonuclease [Deltaproteobacteria bacterium]|nr:TatD family deoxyribonuclease [Deltaproteobacteria bacterium]TLN01141.1 MAG: TatD family deoxyribonuclease [bacterium]
MFIDSHCHLDHPALAARLADVLVSARAVGVERFIIPGVTPEKWSEIARLASTTEGVSAAFGLHPMFADRYDDRMLDELAGYAADARAIGEIGLDYALDEVSRNAQKTAFRGQLRLAVRMGLPVIIHCRRAFEDLMQILREEHVREVGGVMHAYSGSAEMARIFIGENLLISFSGTITYRNAVKGPLVASRVALEHLLLETDSPDLAPEPYRGKVNEPAFLLETARMVAAVKGVEVEEVARVTTSNAERLFRIG